MLTRSPALPAARVHDMDDGQTRAGGGGDGVTNFWMIGHGEDQTGPPDLGRSDTGGNGPWVALLHEGAMDFHQRVEGGTDPFESAGEALEEDRLRPHENDLDAEEASMDIRKSSRIVERQRSGDHLLDRAGRTPPRPLSTRSTVAVPTPACLAISEKVALGMLTRRGPTSAVDVEEQFSALDLDRVRLEVDAHRRPFASPVR